MRFDWLQSSKTVPAERIAEAGELRGCVLGENKVQEARDKIETLGTESYHWHFIGRLQRNKVKYIPGLFEMIPFRRQLGAG